MRPLVFSLVAVSVLAVPAFSQLATPAPLRQWAVTGGATFQASIVSYDGTNVVFRMPNGSRAQAPAAKMSAEDQQFLTEWQKKQPIKVVLPDVVGVETAQVKAEVVSEDPAAEKFVYRTSHFEFESQGKFTQSLLREVARDFEATYELVKALPWNVEPRPPSGDYFHARLLKDKASYYAAGGLSGSGGVYKSREELFLVPFESIGVKVVGKSYAKDDKFESHTMVHELTHQMMHFWLDFLPQWIVEGAAEYTGILPLRTGHFRVSAAKNGMKDYIEFLKKRTVEGLPEPYPLDELFTITNEHWNSVLAQDSRMAHRLYFTSYLLVYYFMHLDGKGDGQLFARYFREVSAAEKDVEKYRAAIEVFKKQPGVEVSPDGSFRWRGDLKAPEKPAILATPGARDEFSKKTLEILLDGRSQADLMKQIRSAYVRLGIRL
ncbi:MAG: hypothetical protein QOE70_1121 [Chthoniobacter sp.]|jgi:hypothetical protein|nr:hypothetical protein [Chthoniobacter sp.]